MMNRYLPADRDWRQREGVTAYLTTSCSQPCVPSCCPPPCPLPSVSYTHLTLPTTERV